MKKDGALIAQGESLRPWAAGGDFLRVLKSAHH